MKSIPGDGWRRLAVDTLSEDSIDELTTLKIEVKLK